MNDIEIKDFKGPLDLLLHFVKEEKVDIWDINLVFIVDKYTTFLYGMKKLNLDVAAEYLLMAASLVEYKSKMLFPSDEELIKEADNFREELLNKIINYEEYKKISLDFADLINKRSSFFEPPAHDVSKFLFLNNSEIDVELLKNAFKNLLLKVEFDKPIERRVTKKEYSIRDRAVEIMEKVNLHDVIFFTDLFDFLNKDYIVVTFLSLLLLANEAKVYLKQDLNNGEILIKGGNANGN